ncbi:MAG: ABC transporter permease [Bifidobacteriaceae bacterium]|nr:ABC transporter permease [Bifidobacteriaceae bacterium]
MGNSIAADAGGHDQLHVYAAGRHGLPNLGQYVKDLVARWPFAAEFSRSSIRSANTDTVFGQLWLVINPTLLAVVYFILVVILTGQDIARGGPTLVQICCGLFLFTMFQGAASAGAGSVTGGGALISRMAFPRLLMPFAAVRTSFFRFLPTLPVFLLLKLVLTRDSQWGPEMALSVYFLVLMVVFAAGMAAFMAALQVYFRDVGSFLPYFLRIWMYLSPVLWPISDYIPGGDHQNLFGLMLFNPMFSICGGWSEALLNSAVAPWQLWVVGLGWSVAAFVVGALFFMSKERDFAVRI